MDFIDYSNFSNNGVTVADTFDSWRRKSNGVIRKIDSLINDVDLLYSDANHTLIRYVTLDSAQTIDSTKTFSGGTNSSPVLKVDSAGFYYDQTDSSLASTAAFKSPRLINSGPSIQLGAISYNVPTNNPGGNSLLSKDGQNMSWISYSSIVSQLQSEASVNVVTTNEVLPVGTIQAYTSIGSTPVGWLPCDGSRFLGSDYPELAELLLNRYGTVYKDQYGTSASSVASSQTSYVAENWYTLPDMRGRVAIGAGTGNDGINPAQTFSISASTSYGGKYQHTLITSELPAHTHTVNPGGVHSHNFNLETDEYDRIVAFGSSGINSGIDNDISYIGDGTASANDRIIKIADSDSHIHSLNNTGESRAHTIVQPYTVANYIIKAKPDSVIASQIVIGSGIAVTRNGNSQTYISLTDYDDSILSVKHDSTLKVNQNDSSIGLNDAAVATKHIANASITPEKLSAYAPSWDLAGTESALYEGSGSSKKRVATRDWVNSKIVDGPVQSLFSKSRGARNTSAAVGYESIVYGYIDKDGVPCMTGYHANSGLAPTDTAGGYTPYPLPLDDGYEIRATKLWACDTYIVALASNGKLYARGKNSYNMYNVSSYVDEVVYNNWTLIFDSVYSYNGDSRTIVDVVLSFDPGMYTMGVLDNTGALWLAGLNCYGQLGNGTQTPTGSSSKPLGSRYEANPSLANVKEAIIVGGWAKNNCTISVAAVQWSNSARTAATIRTVGYGEFGQMGTGSNTAINNSWQTAAIPTEFAAATCTLYANGSKDYTSFLALNSIGSICYGWGYNNDLNLGISNTVPLLPVQIWNSTDSGPATQRGLDIEKLYSGTTTHGESSTYILTKATDSEKKQIWACGVNKHSKWGTSNYNNSSIVWTNITPTNRPTKWQIEDFYVGQSWANSTNNFIKWKIVNNPTNSSYQLEASGLSENYSTGTGLNSSPLPTWTRVNLQSEIVKSVVDCQTGRNYMQSRSYSYLLCDDGSLYFSGITHYANNPHGLDGYASSNFIRIK